MKTLAQYIAESKKEPKYYVAADCNSEYFDDYDEAYEYAKKEAQQSMKDNPTDWEEIHLMDNIEWESLVIFSHKGIDDLENSTHTDW